MNSVGPSPTRSPPVGNCVLGAVPNHWEWARLKGIATNVVHLTRESRWDDIYLALEHVESWTGRFTIPHESRQLHGQVKRFAAGDVLFGKLRPYLAKVAYPDRNGVCVGEFLVLRPSDARLSARYLYQILRSKPVIDAVDASTFGAKMPRADWQFIGNMNIPLPAISQQRAIARFLDAADRRIRRYIRAKEWLIELLEERKRALIHEAVTGRIDVRTGQPYPAYKDSGIEWLGKVPEHWEVRRLGATTERLVTGTWGSDPTGRDDIVCVRVADFDRQRWGVDLREPTLRSVPLGERQGRLLAAGDLLLEKSGGGDLQPVGAVVHFDHDQEAVASNFIGRMRVRKQNRARYVLYLNSVLYALRITVRSIKQTTGIQNLDVGAYLGESVPLPPPSEQTAIVGFLDAADRRILRHISATKRQIALVKEYRTRLIADVVTGKLDVREAAADLPETDPLATNRDGTEVIPTESNLQPTAHDMAKEAVP